MWFVVVVGVSKDSFSGILAFVDEDHIRCAREQIEKEYDWVFTGGAYAMGWVGAAATCAAPAASGL